MLQLKLNLLVLLFVLFSLSITAEPDVRNVKKTPDRLFRETNIIPATLPAGPSLFLTVTFGKSGSVHPEPGDIIKKSAVPGIKKVYSIECEKHVDQYIQTLLILDLDAPSPSAMGKHVYALYMCHHLDGGERGVYILEPPCEPQYYYKAIERKGVHRWLCLLYQQNKSVGATLTKEERKDFDLQQYAENYRMTLRAANVYLIEENTAGFPAILAIALIGCLLMIITAVAFFGYKKYIKKKQGTNQ